MRPYIPSLQSLLAFEAASRHRSFTRASQELQLTQTAATFDEFERNSYDVAIRYGSGRWASVRSDRLRGEEFFPVCAPSVLEEAGTFTPMAEGHARFRQIRTYFYSMYQNDWPTWLEAAVQETVEFASQAVFHLQLTSLAAVVDGVGSAIGRASLVDADLASGKLVQPFDVRVRSNSAYSVSSPYGKVRLKKVEFFRDWVLDALGEGASRPAAERSRASGATSPAEQHTTTCLAPAPR